VLTRNLKKKSENNSSRKKKKQTFQRTILNKIIINKAMLGKLENMLYRNTESLDFNLCETLHNSISIILNKNVRNSKLISTVMVYIMLHPHMLRSRRLKH
jgi:hypothetical protein